MAKKLSLRDRCLAEAPEVRRPGNWLEKLEPDLREEVRALILEWHAGGEVRKSYPSLRSLSRWLTQVDGIKASVDRIREVAANLNKASTNG